MTAAQRRRSSNGASCAAVRRRTAAAAFLAPLMAAATPNIPLVVRWRGGGAGTGAFGRPLSRSSHALHRDRLEEELTVAERRLRAARDEIASLRRSVEYNASTARRDASHALRRAVTAERELREEAEVLRTKIEVAAAAMDDLRVELELERAKTAELTEELGKERNRAARIERDAQDEADRLRSTLLEEMERRVQEVKHVSSERLEEERVRWEKDAEDRVEAERLRCEDAVERERVKMRKLVRALADKEKREAEREGRKRTGSPSLSSGDGAVSSRKTVVGSRSSGSQQAGTTRATSVRGNAK